MFVEKQTSSKVPMGSRNVWLEEAMFCIDTECQPVSLQFEDPVSLLYKSGSIGKYQRVSHSSAGYLNADVTQKQPVFDYKTGEMI